MSVTRTSTCANGMIGTAVFSDDMRHRYLLTRAPFLALPGIMALPGKREGFPLFVMLNPSTATEAEDDPTIRRCAGFARRLGYHSFRICNLFSFRATDPKAMTHADDAEGDPANMDTILLTAAEADLVICAWGALGSWRRRADDVARALRFREQAKMRCLGRTGDGSPRHPLYLSREAALIPYTGLGFVAELKGA